MWLLLYILAFAALALNAPDVVWTPGAQSFFVIVGVIGLWRYGWGAVHFVRSIVYRSLVFPQWRSRADRASLAAKPPADPADAAEIAVVITTHRIPTRTTQWVYQAAIAELIAYGRPALLVASVVELADQRLIKTLFLRESPPPWLRLVFVRRPGLGKREALAAALQAVARGRPATDALVAVVDGDTVLTPGSIARTAPLLHALPEFAGLTTDEEGLVAERDRPALAAWHRLRFAQRHLLMSSMALSKRLLTLTGRMSLFRAGVALDPSFVAAIRDDHIDHWRLGRIRLLTGEDKSTWFWLLQRGQKMLYAADVKVSTIEHPVRPGFFAASSVLMLRWFGNMLRTNGRAIALGPGRMGLFTWWCLIDQRISMWTPLIGPMVALSFAVFKDPAFLYAYLLWIMATRFVQTLSLLSVRDWVSGFYPLMIYYSQIWGACIKTWVLFRLDRQRWTRQDIAAKREESVLRNLGSTFVHALALFALASAVAFATGALDPPSAARIARLM